MRVADKILVLLIIFTFKLNAQEIDNKILSVDSTKLTINYLQEKIQFKNFFQGSFHRRISQTDLSSLRLYNEINDKILFSQNYFLSNKDNFIDSTENFKQSFALLMEYEKHNQNKYDLGEFGRYLGISKDIMTIILALISVAK
ncbi:MAG: hypothetical protein WAU11_01240 [Ignavibacteriaceae bacterium]